MRVGIYVLKMIAYNGFNYELIEGSLTECRVRAKRRIAWYKAQMKGTVASLQRGREWELTPPDDAFSIGDCDGYLKISRVASRE